MGSVFEAVDKQIEIQYKSLNNDSNKKKTENISMICKGGNLRIRLRWWR